MAVALRACDGTAVLGRARNISRSVKADRGTIASSVLLIGVAVSLAAAAMAAEGYKTPDLDLHDSGVWISWTENGWAGRNVTQVNQVDVKIADLGDFELLQSDEHVLVHRPGALIDIDGRRAIAGEQSLALPEGAQVGLGGPGQGVDPTTAVLGSTGALWVASGRELFGQQLVAGDDESEVTEPAATFVGATDLAVGLDGIARALVPGDGEVVGVDASGVAVEPSAVATADEGHEYALTSVGSVPVVLDVDEQLLLLPGGIRHGLAEHGGGARLQQPGSENDVVFVATDDALLEVPLDGSDIVVVTDEGTGGAAAPVYVAGCAWMAWSGAPTYGRHCETGSGTTLGELPGLDPKLPLEFRTNRGKVVINQLETGKAYLLGDGAPDDITWAYALEPEDDDPDSDQETQEEEPDRSDEQVPPEAVPDTGADGFATRPDRTVVVDPLRNDTDENLDVLVIESTDAVQPGGARVEIVNGGLAVQVTPAPGSDDTVTFSYAINDGYASSEPARVEVRVVDPSENTAPECDRGVPQTTFVRAGASVVHNVLATASDGEGDSIALTVPVVLDSAMGTVVADENGTMTYRPPGVGFAGQVEVRYEIVDELGDATRCTLLVDVRAEDAPNEPPTARNDHAVSVVGHEVVVDVLANDSDPDGDALRVVGVSPFAGAEISVDQLNRIHVTPSQRGVVIVEYSISDGPSPPQSAFLRVDVSEAGGDNRPVAVRDDVILRPTVPAVADVLQNDTDIDGDVLVVVRPEVPEDVPLSVEVLDRQYLRISPRGGGLLDRTVQFRYVVTDGRSEATGSVVVRPGATTTVDQPPDAVDDVFSVRAGSIAALQVLANDSDPEGAPLTARLRSDEEQEPGVRGKSFTQGDLVRFSAPAEQGTFRIAYEAVDPANNADAAFVTVHVLPKATANKAPDAPDIVARAVAGRPVTIEVPVRTMDPDGDAVTLLGIGDRAPGHGSVTKVGADRLTFLPDRFDVDGDGKPDGFFGTDTFTYRVRDALGAEGVGTIRIGVAPPPVVNSPPVAIDDSRRAGEGGQLVVDVIRNDSDPDDDELAVDTEAGLGLPPGAGFRAEIVDGRIHFDGRGLSEGEEASITYTVTDGILTDTGLLRVTVTEAGNLTPIAVDDRHETTPAGASATVPVLANDFDPDGEQDDLRVVAVTGAGEVSPDGRAIVIRMPSETVELVYTVEDASGGRARAVVRVPVADGARRRPVAVYDEATIEQGRAATVAVLDNDLSSPGTTKRLFDTSDARNGTCDVSGTKVVFTPNPGFVGFGGCTYLMGDGPGDDPATLRANGMVGVIVKRSGNTPPTFVDQRLVLTADSELTRDLRSATEDPDDGHRDALTFEVTDGEDGVVTADFDGSKLTVRASASAEEGSEVRLTITVTDPGGEKATGGVTVALRRFTGALAVAVPDRYETFQDVTTQPLPVLANDQLSASGEPLKIVGVSSVSGGTLAHDERTITFDPEPGFFGQTTFTYTVDDGTGYADRRVTGTVTVNVIGRPGLPPAPAVERESGAIVLSWGVPSPNGAPITEYKVKANGGPVSDERVRTTSGNTLRFDGLTNGEQYTFQIAAVNSAVTEGLAQGTIADYEYSPPSVAIVPNQKPNTPNAPLAEFTAADHGGQTVTVSWTDPGGDGTAVDHYLIEISPAPASGPAQQRFEASGARLQHQISGLANGVPYTFRVQAFNTIQGDVQGESGWSAWSNAETPATRPETPLAPQIVEEGDGYIVVGWEAPAENGDAISAYVVEYGSGGGASETPEIPATERSRRVDTTNAQSYTFRVKAKNKAGFSPYSPASQPAVSYGVPGPATQVDASEGDGQSVLTVPGMPDSNGRSISSWQYRSAVNGAAFPSDPAAGWSAFGGPGTAVPASNGSSHRFQVRACNQRGCAQDPGAASNTVVPYGVPHAPNVNGTVNGTSITWSWTSTGDNGRAISSWQYRINGGGWTTVPTATTSHTTNHGYSTTVTFEVRGVNLRGPGSIGSATRTTVPAPPPPTQNVVTNEATCPESEFSFPSRFSAGPPPTCDGGFIARGTALTVECDIRPGSGWTVDGDQNWYRMTNGPRPGWYVAGATIDGENPGSLPDC